jgi:hypothetical protein
MYVWFRRGRVIETDRDALQKIPNFEWQSLQIDYGQERILKNAMQVEDLHGLAMYGH